MSDITTSAISCGGSSPAARMPSQELGTSLPTGGAGTVGETASTGSSSRVTQNTRLSQSQSQLMMLDQRTQPQDPAAFGMMLLAAMLLGGNDDEEKSNPLKMLIGMALLSGLQQQLQGGQSVRFESQSYEFSQSITATESSGSQQYSYQHSTGSEGGASLGGQIDVQG